MASDAMKTARALIARRSADPKAKMFGLDKDLQVLGAALDELESDQRYIAHCIAHMCPLVHALLAESSPMRFDGSRVEDPGMQMLVRWQKRLREIGGQ